jgi:hypothetical protein
MKVTSHGYAAELPADNADTRSALYAGQLYHHASTAASRALVDDVHGLLAEQFGALDARYAQAELTDAEFFARIGRIRKRLFEDPHFHDRAFAVAESMGFARDEVAFDPLRLRVVSHDGHHNVRAAPIYYPHRDTWFALSRSVIACWVAVHDIAPTETFEVYPEWLERPVGNTSEHFDYDRWVRDHRSLRIGWQDQDAGKEVHYSGTREVFSPGVTVPLAAERGDVVLFSGAHLHKTRENTAGYTRYSLDFRMVHKADHYAGRGPANVDNRSTGDATRDYVGITPRPSAQAG